MKNTTHRPTRTAARPTGGDYIDALCEAGFSPSDEVDGPSWLAQRYEAAIVGSGTVGCFIVANCDNDRLLVQVITPSGVICEELGFSAPDYEVSPLTVAALVAVTAAWSNQ